MDSDYHTVSFLKFIHAHRIAIQRPVLLSNVFFSLMFLWQILSVADLCCAYLFLARYNLKKRNLEAAEMYAHKCCEFNEVGYIQCLSFRLAL